MSHLYKNTRKVSILVLVLILLAVLFTTTICSAVTAYGLTEEYWQVKLGDETIAIVKTQDEAKGLIQQVQDHYVTEGMDLKQITFEPSLSIETLTVKVREEQPVLTEDPREVVNQLLSGEGVEATYIVQEGDTLWDVAIALGTDLDTLLEENPGLSDDIRVGDVILYSAKSHVLTVTTESEVVGEAAIEFETVYEDTDDLLEGEEKVKVKGENGIRCFTAIEIKENGHLVSREETDSRVIKAPIDEVILRGTKVEEPEEEEEIDYTVEDAYYEEVSYEEDDEEYYPEETYYEEPAYEEPAQETVSYSGDLQNTVLNAAYSQLGVGQDCTSLVTNSLAAAGIYFHGWPQQYASLGDWTSSPVPGDLVIYDTHVAVYAGGSSAVHGGWNGGTTDVGPVYCSANLIGYIHIG